MSDERSLEQLLGWEERDSGGPVNEPTPTPANVLMVLLDAFEDRGCVTINGREAYYGTPVDFCMSALNALGLNQMLSVVELRSSLEIATRARSLRPEPNFGDGAMTPDGRVVYLSAKGCIDFILGPDPLGLNWAGGSAGSTTTPPAVLCDAVRDARAELLGGDGE